MVDPEWDATAMTIYMPDADRQRDCSRGDVRGTSSRAGSASEISAGLLARRGEERWDLGVSEEMALASWLLARWALGSTQRRISQSQQIS